MANNAGILGLGPLAAFISSKKQNTPGLPAAPAMFSAGDAPPGVETLRGMFNRTGGDDWTGAIPQFPGTSATTPGTSATTPGASTATTSGQYDQQYDQGGQTDQRSYRAVTTPPGSGTVAPTGGGQSGDYGHGYFEGQQTTINGVPYTVTRSPNYNQYNYAEGVITPTTPAPFNVNGENFTQMGRTPHYDKLPTGVTAPDYAGVQSTYGHGGGMPTRYNPWHTENWQSQETPAMTSDYMVRNSIIHGVNKDLGYAEDSPTFFEANQSQTVIANNARAWDLYSQRMVDAGLGGLLGDPPKNVPAGWVPKYGKGGVPTSSNNASTNTNTNNQNTNTNANTTTVNTNTGQNRTATSGQPQRQERSTQGPANIDPNTPPLTYTGAPVNYKGPPAHYTASTPSGGGTPNVPGTNAVPPLTPVNTPAGTSAAGQITANTLSKFLGLAGKK